MDDIRFVVFDPGHFHAALVLKEMYPEVSRTVHVYGALAPDLDASLQRMLRGSVDERTVQQPGPDLLAFQQHVERFNTRTDKPTSWNLETHGWDPLLLGMHQSDPGNVRSKLGPNREVYRMLRDRPGNVVVLAGRNPDKINTIHECLKAGLHVLADKPWILSQKDLESLEEALDLAEEQRLIALDIMTERHEITTILQREFVQDEEVFGSIESGNDDEPGVLLESVHSIKKRVAGNPLVRPAIFFDVAQQGEGLTDVGTHLVDLIPWVLFPEQAIDAFQELNLNSAKRWSTPILLADFQAVTGLTAFPDFLKPQVQDGVLHYFCNNSVKYCLCGIHVALDIRWDLQTASGGDWHHALFRGTRSSVEVRQVPEKQAVPELFVHPRNPRDLPELRKAVAERCRILENHYRDLEVQEQNGELRIAIPNRYRIGHEAHFGAVTRLFLDYVLQRQRLPEWEKPNMLAKYRLTTAGVHLARGGI